MKLRHGILPVWTIAAFGLGFLVRSLIPEVNTAPSWHRVRFVRVGEEERREGLPLIDARDKSALKSHAGRMARVRGLVERVGYSERSNTYFLNIGALSDGFTGVVFDSSTRAFQKQGIHLKRYEGKIVEITGRLRDDPVYGLEIFVEDPKQIRVE